MRTFENFLCPTELVRTKRSARLSSVGLRLSSVGLRKISHFRCRNAKMFFLSYSGVPGVLSMGPDVSDRASADLPDVTDG